MQNKPDIEHIDLLGCTIRKGDTVAYAQHNTLCIGIIVKSTAKMVRVKKITSSRYRREQLKYPEECIKIEGSTVLAYIIKNSQ